MLSDSALNRRAQERLDYAPTGFTVNAAAYASGNQFGSVITIGDQSGLPDPFQDGLSVILQGLVLIDTAGQNMPFDAFFFSALPSFNTDHAAWAPTAADMLNCLGKVSVLATDYAAAGAAGGGSVADKAGLGKVLKAAAAGNGPQKLYAVLVARGAGTFGANAVLPRFQFSQGL